MHVLKVVNGTVTRDQLMELIAEFSAPIGPDVFAGFGSELQNSLAEWSEDGGQYIEKTDAYLMEWAEKADFEETLSAIVDILKNPPGREFHNNFCVRLKDDWEYGLSVFIAALARRDPAALVKELKPLIEDPGLTRLVFEILESIEEEQRR